MVERSPIFSAKNHNQEIGYIEGTEAFDLLGNKRCNYNPSTGNLREPDSGRTMGHVSLAGHFVGLSWIADELFPQPGSIAAPTPSPDETTSGYPQALFHWSIAQHGEALTTSPKEDANQTVPAISRDEPVSAAAIMPTASYHEPTDTASIVLPLAPDDLAAANLPTTSSDESSASAISLKSLDEPAATDAATLTTSFDERPAAVPSEAPLSSEAEGALEMIRMTLAMNFSDTNPQAVTNIAMQMREHLAGLRKKRPRAPAVFRYSMGLPAASFDGWKHER